MLVYSTVPLLVTTGTEMRSRPECRLLAEYRRGCPVMELRTEDPTHLAGRIVEAKVGSNGEHGHVDVVGRVEPAAFEVRVARPTAVVDVHGAVSCHKGEQLSSFVMSARCLLLLFGDLLGTLCANPFESPLEILRRPIRHAHQETTFPSPRSRRRPLPGG